MPSSRFNNETTASVYQRLLLPRVFTPWGKLLVTRAGVKAGDRVLDVATGPGTVARLAAELAGPRGRVSGVDNSAPMLAQAKDKPPVPGGAPLDYFEALANGLPFPKQAFDVALCQQGLQFFPDPLGALKELQRVLKPGGRVALAMWAGPKAMTLFSSFLEAVDATVSQGPRLTALHWLDAAQLEGLMREAGFKDVQVTEEVLNTHLEQGLPQALACVDGTSAGTTVRAMAPEERHQFEARVARALAPWEQDGALVVPARSLIAVGTA